MCPFVLGADCVNHVPLVPCKILKFLGSALQLHAMQRHDWGETRKSWGTTS